MTHTSVTPSTTYFLVQISKTCPKTGHAPYALPARKTLSLTRSDWLCIMNGTPIKRWPIFLLYDTPLLTICSSIRQLSPFRPPHNEKGETTDKEETERQTCLAIPSKKKEDKIKLNKFDISLGLLYLCTLLYKIGIGRL